MSNLARKVTKHIGSGAGRTGASSPLFRGSQQYTGRPVSQGGTAGGTIPEQIPGGPRNRRGRSGGVRSPLGPGGGY